MELLVTHPTVGTLSYSVPAGTSFVLGRGSDRASLELAWDPAVSRTHARIWREPGTRECWFEDLGSRNGSFANGVRLVGPIRFRPDLVLRVGDSQLRIVADLEDARAGGSVEPDLPPLRIAFLSPHRVTIRGRGLQRLYRDELAHRRLFVPSPDSGGEPPALGTRVQVELALNEKLFLLPSSVVHRGAHEGSDGVGLAVDALPEGLLSALERGIDETAATTVELKAPALFEDNELVTLEVAPPSELARLEPWNLRAAESFVRNVAADLLYDALATAPESSDDDIRAALARWQGIFHDDDIVDELGDLADPLARALGMLEAQLGTPEARLRYDFTHGHIFAERRTVLADRGEGPSRAELALTWRRAFPSQTERAQKLWVAAEQAVLSGRIDEARQLRDQARHLAPFQHSLSEE